MTTPTRIKALCGALDGREFRIGARVFTAYYEYPGFVSLSLGADAGFYIHATPDYDGETDTLPLDVQREGAFLDNETTRVDWSEDTETNVSIWWALVAPYVRKHVPECGRETSVTEEA